MGVPIALQERNASPGVATRLLSRWARDIYLGFPEARDYLRPGTGTSVFMYGNPIIPPKSREERDAARARLGIPAGIPILLVMGGSQGARAINVAVRALVDAGSLEGIALLWSTGRATWSEYADYHKPPTRMVREFWDPISEAYSVADLVVARAGAMTTAEICAWGLPAIYVPLPRAAADHQTRNALALAEAGAAMHLPESQLSPVSLREAVLGTLEQGSRLASMREAARARGRPDAALQIASRILGVVS